MFTIYNNTRKRLFGLVLLVIFTASACAEVGPNWIEQWGIRWTFDKNISLNGTAGTYRYGQFVNGDYWIIGPVTIIGISPTTTMTNGSEVGHTGIPFPAGKVINGTMINPRAGVSSHGYNEGMRTQNPYLESLNAAIINGSPLNSQNPRQVLVNSSVISTVSTTIKQGTEIFIVPKTATVLTVLPEDAFDDLPESIVPTDCFRPGYAGLTKKLYHTKGLTERASSILKNLAPVGNPPSAQTWTQSMQVYAAPFQQPFLQHRGGWPLHQMFPRDACPPGCFDSYGREFQRAMGIVGLLLNLDTTVVGDKTELMIGVLQAGIDLASCVLDDSGRFIFDSDGGHMGGRRLVIFMAAKLLDEPTLISVLQKSGNHLHSIAQTLENVTVTFNGSNPVRMTKISHGLSTGNYVKFSGFDNGLDDLEGTITKINDDIFDIQGSVSSFFSAGNVQGTVYKMYGPGGKDSGNIFPANTPPDFIAFGEDQVSYVKWYHVDVTSEGGIYTNPQPDNPTGGQWRWDSRDPTVLPYPEESIGMPEWFGRFRTMPNFCNNSITCTYRNTACVAFAGNALVVHMMNGKQLWNHDAFLDYCDRWVQWSTYPINDSFTQQMWNAYRANYDPVWPNNTNQPTSYTLVVFASNGSVNRSLNKTAYADGETVTLTATPYTGYTFTGWSGAVTGTSNPVTITMDGNKSITANFAPITYTVTFDLDGKGTRTGGGALSQNIASGGSATAPTVSANTGWTFAGWDKPLTNITAAQTIKATYTQQVQTYTVTFDLDGKGTRTGGGALSQNIASGGSATAPTVSANTGWTFAGWDKPLTNITAAQTIKATYTQQVQTYTVSFDLDGKGTRTGGGALSQNIASGGSATAPTVSANTGWTFSGWDKPLTNITAAQTIKATYTQQQEYRLTTSAVNGSVTVSPVKSTYLWGEVVRLTAAPAAGYVFSGWAGDAAGTTLSITIVMNGDKNITAVCRNDSMVKSMSAHWVLDEHYQETVRDLVSQQVATLIDNAQWSDGWKSDHVLLTTGRQALQIPMTKTSAANGSLILWVRPDSVQGMQIVFGHSVNTSNRLALYLAAGNLAVGVGNVLQSGLCTLNVGQFYQIALTWSGTGYAVYVDGVQKGNGVFNGLTALNSIADVGNYGDPINRDSGMGFLGAIERVQLYSRALSANEARELADTKYIRENRTLSFTLSGRDGANNPIQYNIQNMPQGAVFDVNTQTFSWLPSLYNASGNYTVVFVADNQPNKAMTISVLNAALKSWYKDFLIMAGNKVN